MTPANIKSGFRKTGIFPFHRHIFKDGDFMPSEVTNRPLRDSSNDAGLSQPFEAQQAFFLMPLDYVIPLGINRILKMYILKMLPDQVPTLDYKSLL
ncbi:unnamed protein product [Parnassius apollo]|uniref:(apollo) hypothetical protein n=1 Tax=Parnassius apollo TaxID=110799 RepID=A0A8S3W4Z3_PARAO|nr:unnamed protein product [Parnassius apollo]